MLHRKKENANRAGRLALTVLLGASIGSAHARAEAADCNNLIAVNQDPEIIDDGGDRTCGVGLVIFGFGGSIWGEKCPKVQHKIPAHQVCQSVELPIPDVFHCKKELNVPVYTRENDCGGAVIPYIEVGIPTSCIYGEWKENGDVEDFETLHCGD